MTAGNNRALTELLQQVRRRTWIQAVIDAGSIGVALSAALLLATGLLQIVTGRLAVALWLPVVLAPAILMPAGAVLFRRPSLSHAARTADRWFNGKELLVSAWQLARSTRPVHTSSESLVIARANERSRKWRKEISTQHPYAVPAYNLISTISIATAVLLINLTATGSSPESYLLPVSMQHDGNPGQMTTAGFSSLLKEQLMSTSDIDTGAEESGHPERHGMTYRPAAAEQNIPQKNRDQDNQPAATTYKNQAEHNPASPGAGDMAGSTGGHPGREQTATPDQLPDSEIRTVKLPRKPVTSTATAAGSRLGSALDESHPGPGTRRQTGITVQASEQGGQPYAAEFKPAYRTLIANYFKRTENR